MTTRMSTCVVLAQRPDGMPSAQCWALDERPVPALAQGQVLVDIDTLSIDPAMRAWMNEYCYVGCVELGQPMWAFAVGTVLESRHADYAVGDPVRGLLTAQRYAVAAGEALEKLDVQGEPLSNHLSIYGMTGLTAYFGMTDLVEIRPAQQVLVSTAAGAVGSVAAQIAKMQGARVVGIAGGPGKVEFCLRELGLDACIDYKAPDMEGQLQALMPDGVDVYFDNVGVPTLDIVLNQMNEYGSIIICGAINQFQNMDRVQGPSEYLKIPERHLSMRGFTYFHYADRFGEGIEALRRWVADGSVKFFEDTEQGLENFPAHFIKLFTGKHRGKLCIKP